ncbi:hypothetical protein CBER1_00654 [Cercospora berteroae]|uniref:Uncharacterized protein n=1 Tax=Cercospora berteroae TaxID=357750 RepID=A0A2S6C9F3_9PEZI|nr:hypothetical protein CBER1_00654 [Cercospora berteroae]
MNPEATLTTTIMSSGRLLNRVAIVTGSSSGLGRAIALQLAAEGARICCVDLYENPRNKTNAATGKADDFNNRTDGETTVQELHRLYGEERAVFVYADMTKAEQVEHMVTQCVEKYGRIDILCNNAGISVESTHPTPLPIHLLPEFSWDLTMSINVKSIFLGSKYTFSHICSPNNPSLRPTAQPLALPAG